MPTTHKYTQQEFENKFHDRYPYVKITGEYKGSAEKIKYICPCCNKEHEKKANEIMNGHFCRQNIGKNNPYKKTTVQFVEEIKNVDPFIKITGEYVNANTPIEFLCKCGNKVTKPPAQMLLGYTKCQKCSHNRITFAEFKAKLSVIRPEITITEENINDSDYIIKSNKISYICECGNKDIKSMESLLKGVKCPSCNSRLNSIKAKKTHEEFVNEVRIVNPTVEILSEYVGGDKPIKFKCSCGNIDTKTARELIRKKCCCSQCRQVSKKTTEQFIEEMKVVNPAIIITGKYVNAETPIEFICECGTKHRSAPSALLLGHRCGHCNMSKSEYVTKYYLEDHSISYNYDYKFADCINKIPLKFDFYLPEYNTCIELDGEHHYRPVAFKGISQELAKERHEYTKKLDAIKNEYCLHNSITLIRIAYWDFPNIAEILDKHLFNTELRIA